MLNPRVLTFISIVFFLIFPIQGKAQETTISGVVTQASNGEPIPGVTILVPSTTIGTITNLNGEYTLSLPDLVSQIEFRSVGMATQVVLLQGRNQIDIQLKEELYAVDEVVVTALGITRDSKALGYSVTSIGSDELTQASDKSALNALSGKIAGVNITSASGAPGSSTRILMRGVSSLSGSNQPLFVIDGVPISNSSSGSSSINGGTDFGNKMNDLNPEDIASISVLKGASGTALYGSRASNGVFIITTKKGNLNTRTSVSFSSAYSFEEPLKLVEYQNKYGQGIQGNSVLYENMSWGPEFDSRYRPWGHEVDNSIRVKAYQPLPTNVEEFFETGHSLTNSLSISGGTQATTYYFSCSNITWDGIFPTDADSYNKNTISLRGSHRINKKLLTTTAFNYIKKKNSSVPTGQGSQVYNQIMQTPRDISLLEQEDLENPFNTLDNHYSLYTVNPYFILKNNGNENNEDRFFGSIDVDLDILKGFSAKWRLGGDVSNATIKTWEERIEPEGNNEQALVFDPGSEGRSSGNQYQINSDVILSYTKAIQNWEFTARVGHTINQRSSYSLGTGVSFLSLPGYHNLSNTTESPTSFESSALLRQVGVYGMADLSFKNYWFLSLTGRNEWSSTLPEQNNSYFFPGVNTSLVVSDLLQGSKRVLSFAKVRASWGKVGNDAAPYSVYPVYSSAGHTDGYGYYGYPLSDGVNSYDIGNRIGNENLKPEMTTEYEVGLDLRLFQNRLSFDLAYYDKSTVDLIWSSPVSSASGYSYRTQNLGKISNHGIEALVSFVPVRTNNLTWDFTINFTRNYNKLDYLNNQLEDAELNALRVDGGQQISWLAIPGEAVGVFKARTAMTTPEGKIVVDNQGLPKAAEDLKTYGNSQYTYYGGVLSSINYKGFTLGAGLDIRMGGIMYSRTKNITQWAGTVPETLYNDREPFIIPNSVYELKKDANGNPVYVENTNPIDRVKLIQYWGNGSIELDGSSFLDKSFIKLREVSLSYSLPSKWTDKISIKNIRVGVAGKNLWLWTPSGQTYIDPELTTFGNDLAADFGEYGAQPSVKSLTFNLKLDF